MEKLNLKNFINPLCDIAIKAGNITLKYYKSINNISLKKDKSPLTKADLESNKLILESLLKLNKEIPILSEESLVDWDIRKDWETYWLVDPLDGTKEFIKGNDEFTINIALVSNNLPLLGVIYAPAMKVLYFAYKNGGCFKKIINNYKASIDYFDDAIKLEITSKPKDILKVICSRSHPNDEFNQWIKNNIKDYKITQKGSSLKFCDLAEEKANLYPRLRPSCEWDIAAGHIILTEAGGKIETLDKKEIVYNLKENVKNPYFIAST